MNDFDIRYARLRERSEREDIVMFVNACFAATGQDEYYADRSLQSVSIDFLHKYMLANYRGIYARVTAAGINHFSRVLIVFNLLRAGAPNDAVLRQEEGRLIAATLRSLPVHRVYKLFAGLCREGVNNRRTRAVIKAYISDRGMRSFDFVKYRSKLRTLVRHWHLPVGEEIHRFLFSLKDAKRFSDPLFDTYLRARYSKQAVYELPYTIAEGLAARHGIARDEFLQKIASKMSLAERYRLQSAAARSEADAVSIDLSRTPLTRLALYVLSLSMEERIRRCSELHGALKAAALRAQQESPLALDRVACVLDRSRSSWGSRDRRRRPLAVAVAVHYLVAAATENMQSFWTPQAGCDTPAWGPQDMPFLVEAAGQSDLASPLLDAVQWQPQLILIVSDGHENAPPGTVEQIVSVYKQRFARAHPIAFLHANPVFDTEHFSPKTLGPSLVTLGLRDAEDLSASVRFAKFATGEASRDELETYLSSLSHRFCSAGRDEASQSSGEEVSH